MLVAVDVDVDVDDGRQDLVRLARPVFIVEFDVVDLGAADDLFLTRRRNLCPSIEIVKIPLNDDITAADAPTNVQSAGIYLELEARVAATWRSA